MASQFEDLPNGIISEIFGKTKCAKSLVRCAGVAKRFEPLVLNVNVQTLCIPITIGERFLESVAESVPRPRNRSVHEPVIVWGLTKPPFSVFVKLGGMVRKFSAMILRFKKTPIPLAPPPRNLLVHWPREFLTLGVSSLEGVCGAYMNTLKQSNLLPKLAPPQCLELVLSFPESTPRSVSLIKWRGFCHSLSDFYFVMFMRENVHEICDDFLIPDQYPYRWRTSIIFFKNFWLMLRHAKTGNWFSSVQDVAISYTRSGLHSMREELTNSISIVKYKTKGRRWMQNVVRFPERNLELNGVNLVIIKGDDCMVEDSVIIGEALQGDPVSFAAAMLVYGMDNPIIFYIVW